MTKFPFIELSFEPSSRINELLKQAPAGPLGDELNLFVKEGKFDLEYGPEHPAFSKLWFESMRFFLERRKGDWGVLFQLGVRDLENYWRDQNTQEVFEISQEHLEFESAWQKDMAQKLAILLLDSSAFRNFKSLNYPQKVQLWQDFIEELNSKLRPCVEFELVSFELKEVLQKEEERAVDADRLVLSLSWGPQGMTWTDSTKQRWIKNFIGTLQELTSKMSASPVKWVAEGGQFP